MKESGLLNSHNRAIMSALKQKFLFVIIIFTMWWDNYIDNILHLHNIQRQKQQEIFMNLPSFWSWLPNVVDFVLKTVEVLSHSAPSEMAKYFPLWAVEVNLTARSGIWNTRNTLCVLLLSSCQGLFRRPFMAIVTTGCGQNTLPLLSFRLFWILSRACSTVSCTAGTHCSAE